MSYMKQELHCISFAKHPRFTPRIGFFWGEDGGGGVDGVRIPSFICLRSLSLCAMLPVSLIVHS